MCAATGIIMRPPLSEHTCLCGPTSTAASSRWAGRGCFMTPGRASSLPPTHFATARYPTRHSPPLCALTVGGGFIKSGSAGSATFTTATAATWRRAVSSASMAARRRSSIDAASARSACKRREGWRRTRERTACRQHCTIGLSDSHCPYRPLQLVATRTAAFNRSPAPRTHRCPPAWRQAPPGLRHLP